MTESMNEFTELIDTLSEGATANEATHQLHQLIKACKETGKPGKLTLTITLIPHFGEGPDLEILDKVDSRPPRPDRLPTWTWTDKRHHWSRTNPDQDQLPNITSLHVTREDL